MCVSSLFPLPPTVFSHFLQCKSHHLLRPHSAPTLLTIQLRAGAELHKQLHPSCTSVDSADCVQGVAWFYVCLCRRCGALEVVDFRWLDVQINGGCCAGKQRWREGGSHQRGCWEETSVSTERPSAQTWPPWFPTPPTEPLTLCELPVIENTAKVFVGSLKKQPLTEPF